MSRRRVPQCATPCLVWRASWTPKSAGPTCRRAAIAEGGRGGRADKQPGAKRAARSVLAASAAPRSIHCCSSSTPPPWSPRAASARPRPMPLQGAGAAAQFGFSVLAPAARAFALQRSGREGGARTRRSVSEPGLPVGMRAAADQRGTGGLSAISGSAAADVCDASGCRDERALDWIWHKWFWLGKCVLVCGMT